LRQFTGYSIGPILHLSFGWSALRHHERCFFSFASCRRRAWTSPRSSSAESVAALDPDEREPPDLDDEDGVECLPVVLELREGAIDPTDDLAGLAAGTLARDGEASPGARVVGGLEGATLGAAEVEVHAEIILSPSDTTASMRDTKEATSLDMAVTAMVSGLS
jgi:hypothetical protein